MVTIHGAFHFILKTVAIAFAFMTTSALYLYTHTYRYTIRQRVNRKARAYITKFVDFGLLEHVNVNGIELARADFAVYNTPLSLNLIERY
jgi:hypothetical protein